MEFQHIYLKKEWGESRWRRVARFRLGNEIREGKYWEEKEKKVCRLCGIEKETWEGCREWSKGKGSWQKVVGRILGKEGEGEWWMRELEKKRGKRRKERVWEGEGERGRRGGQR